MKIVPSLISRMLSGGELKGIQLAPERLELDRGSSQRDFSYASIQDVQITKRRLVFRDVRLAIDAEEEIVCEGLLPNQAKKTQSAIRHFQLLPLLLSAYGEFTHLMERERWFAARDLREWETRHSKVMKKCDQLEFRKEWYSEQQAFALWFLSRGPQHFERIRVARNDTWSQCYLKRNHKWFESEAGAFPLTKEQARAVLIDEDHSLVVAGAGTGKTATIVAKAGWLMKRCDVRPASILLLAFQKKAASEIEERLERVFGSSCDVSTFHALGNGIAGMVESEKKPISVFATDKARFNEFVQQKIESLLASGDLNDGIFRYLLEYVQHDDSPFLFESMKQWVFESRGTEYRTLQGEKVKSREERLIADWYFLHSIPYEYEPNYDQVMRHEGRRTASPDRRTYCPDFMIPRVLKGKFDTEGHPGLFHEHFALDEYQRVPDFLNRDNRYIEGVKWKRDLHKSHDNLFIETHSHHARRRVLFELLEVLMDEKGIPVKLRPVEEIVAAFTKRIEWTKFAELVASFLSIAKANGYQQEDLEKEAQKSDTPERTSLFLQIVKHVRVAYEEALRKEGAIDFADMIALATRHVESGTYRSPYQFIIVDEFQDISRGRRALIDALKNQRGDACIYGVGDDWQSIFRFTGSDLRLTTSFEEHWSPSEVAMLSKTFRFNQELLHVSSQFIQENPTQRRKALVAQRRLEERPIEVIFCEHLHGEKLNRSDEETGEDSVWKKVLRSIPREEMQGMQGMFSSLHRLLFKIFKEGEATKEERKIYILARYNYLLPHTFLAKWRSVMRSEGMDTRRLDIQSLTVHRSKGLESDDVIVVGLEEGEAGFPAQRLDDPVMSLVLPELDAYDFPEERRLFYVALTRAKDRVFLLSDYFSPSQFTLELSQPKYGQWVQSPMGKDVFQCPECESSLNKIISKKGHAFWGCSGYPRCDSTALNCRGCENGPVVKSIEFSGCLACKTPLISCPSPTCEEGFLVKRNGKNGPFWGCSRYRDDDCRFSANNCRHCENGPVLRRGSRFCQACSE